MKMRKNFLTGLGVAERPVPGQVIEGVEPVEIEDGGVGAFVQEVASDVDLTVIDGPMEGRVSGFLVLGIQDGFLVSQQPIHHRDLAGTGRYVK